MNQILAAAMKYVMAGWPVLPVRGKVPRTSHGVLDASTDADTVTAWWRRWPDSGVGIATGARSGLVVLDLDPRHGGDDSLRELAACIGALPDTVTCLTGGGGAHYYFAHPGGGKVPCAVSIGGYQGLDLRADGGFVVAPPSGHASGRTYEWDAMAHPADVPLAPCPLALLEMAWKVESIAALDYRPRMEPADVELAEHVVAMLRGKLRRRFQRDARGLRDTSPSGVDASLATLAALAGLAPEHVEAVVRASRVAAGLQPRPASYYAATIGKALAIASEVQP